MPGRGVPVKAIQGDRRLPAPRSAAWRGPGTRPDGRSGSVAAMPRLLCVSCVVLTFGLLAAGSAAAFPGANGVLVFEGSGGLTTVAADGQGLAAIPGTLGLFAASVSPDGRRLAATSSGGLAALDITGANAGLAVTPGAAPAWSPDGTRLAYGRSGDIWVAAADGSGTPLQLTSSPDNDRVPAWSSTGRIAFVSNRGGNTQVWSMASDGSDVRQVSAVGQVEAQRPAWSPDGTRLAFATDDGSISDVYVSDTRVAPGVANDKRITVNGSSAFYNGSPSWSPDGTRIAFESNRTGGPEVWTTAAPGGGDDRRVTTSGGMRPDWQAIPLPPAAPVAPVVSTPPAPTALTPTPRPALKVSTVAQLPSARACVSRRSFAIRLRVPRDAGVREAVVRVNGRRLAVRSGARLRSTVDLRALPKGRFSVEVTLRLADGTSVKETRRYRTCAPKRR